MDFDDLNIPGDYSDYDILKECSSHKKRWKNDYDADEGV